MSKNSFWDSLGNTIETVLFIKYGLPTLVTIIMILFGVAMFNKTLVAGKVDKNLTILHTDLEKVIYEIAMQELNTNEFSLELEDSGSLALVNLQYTVKNKNYSAEQYNQLIKEEVTKVYNRIKDKELVNDTLFGEDDIVDGDNIYFWVDYYDGYPVYLGATELRYSIDNKWEESYTKAMTEQVITQEQLEEVKNSYNK